LTPPLARSSNCRVYLLRSVARLGLAACASLTLNACLFPVFELEESSAPRQLAYAGREPARSHARIKLAPPPSAARQSSTKQPGASVIAPYVPEPEHAPAPLPDTVSECHRALHRAGVRFEALLSQDAPGVRWPVRLLGPVSGVQFEPLDTTQVYTVLDCRLAVALRSWASDLHGRGVRRVQYFSMYRPGARVGGDGGVSGHAHGMAIDAARFTLRDGAAVDVLDDWEGRKLGQAPCPVRSDEGFGSRLLRKITCSAADSRLFQVVLTPHYNKAHGNHVHLEIKPEVDWTYVR
jgi:hypothetical protein